MLSNFNIKKSQQSNKVPIFIQKIFFILKLEFLAKYNKKAFGENIFSNFLSFITLLCGAFFYFFVYVFLFWQRAWGLQIETFQLF